MSWDGPRQRLTALGLASRRLYLPPHDPTVGFFWCLVAVHVLAWTMLTTATQPNVPADTLELLSEGRQFAWGYASHPPMGIWIASAVSVLAAPSIWPLYFLAQLCGAVSVWAAWKLGRKFLKPWTALCGALVLLGGYSCTIAGTDFDGAHLASAFWSLSIYMLHSALMKERRRYWVATGICLGLGFLSSYGTLLLLAAMFAFTLWDDKARRCWDSSWPFLAALAMSVVLLPHLIWLGTHQFITIQRGILPSDSVADHLVEPLSFLGTQLLCLIPIIILLVPLISWFSVEEPAEKGDEPRDFSRRYLLWMTCLPPAVVFALSLVAGPSSGIFARVTNWSYLGVVLLMWGHLSETRLAWRRSLTRTGTAIGLFGAALMAINIMLPQLQREGMSTQFPGRELAREIVAAWHRAGYAGTAPIIAGPSDLVRNAAWYAPSKFPLHLAEGFDPAQPASPYDEAIRQNGGVVVWRLGENEWPNESQLVERFGRVNLQTPRQLQWNSPSDLPNLRLAMAVIPPASARQTATIPNEFFVSPGTSEMAPQTSSSTIPMGLPARSLSSSLPANISSQPTFTPSPLPRPQPVQRPATNIASGQSSSFPPSVSVQGKTNSPISEEPREAVLPPNYPAWRNDALPGSLPLPPSAVRPISSAERLTSSPATQIATPSQHPPTAILPVLSAEPQPRPGQASSIPSGRLPEIPTRPDSAIAPLATESNPAALTTIPILVNEPRVNPAGGSTIPAISTPAGADPFLSRPGSSTVSEPARSFPQMSSGSTIPAVSTPGTGDPFLSSPEFRAQ